MLLNGVNHVAILTNDAKRLHAFYGEVFEAPVTKDFAAGEGGRLSFIDIGPTNELNVFQIEGNTEAERQTGRERGAGHDRAAGSNVCQVPHRTILPAH